MKGVKGNQDHVRAQEGGHTNQHLGGKAWGCIKNPNRKLCREKTSDTEM